MLIFILLILISNVECYVIHILFYLLIQQLKINDEITIIPQPPKIHNLSMKNNNSNKPALLPGKQSSTPTTTKAKVRNFKYFCFYIYMNKTFLIY